MKIGIILGAILGVILLIIGLIEFIIEKKYSKKNKLSLWFMLAGAAAIITAISNTFKYLI